MNTINKSNKITKNNGPLKSLGDYIGGIFLKSPNKGQNHLVQSPADLNDKVFEWASYPDHIEKACETAHKAYPLWSAFSQKERNNLLLKLSRIYKAKAEEIAVLISRETGKPLWESQTEAKALSQKIDITLKKALPLVQDSRVRGNDSKKEVQEKIHYRSKGVFLVLGPFNFPAHLPNGHIIPALATGNTVIFKPSEKTPATAQKLTQCFDLAGFPKGVFNLVQGDANTAKALVQHPFVDGILFTGSYAVGQKIKQSLLNQPQKILALEMGGKNSTLIWKDANIDKAVEEVIKGAYLTCGQRCSSTSRIILHKEIKHTFLKKFIAKSKNIKIGHWSENPFIGPLIDEKATQTYNTAIQVAKKEGALFHLTGERLQNLNGYYVSPSIVEPKNFIATSFYQNEELFSPFVTIYSVAEEEEALNLINSSGYGLCFSVFTQNKAVVQRMCQKAKVGVFHWNLSTNGASSHLPFGGLGKSGNDRPAGLFSVYSCVTPVAYRQQTRD